MTRRRFLASLGLCWVPAVLLPTLGQATASVLHWDTVERAEHYRVFRDGQPWQDTTTTAVAVPDRTSRWAVQAINHAGASPLTDARI
jgi:hypothetical protein